MIVHASNLKDERLQANLYWEYLIQPKILESHSESIVLIPRYLPHYSKVKSEKIAEIATENGFKFKEIETFSGTKWVISW